MAKKKRVKKVELPEPEVFMPERDALIFYYSTEHDQETDEFCNENDRKDLGYHSIYTPSGTRYIRVERVSVPTLEHALDLAEPFAGESVMNAHWAFSQN